MRLQLMGLSLAVLAMSAGLANAQTLKEEYESLESREFVPGGPIGTVNLNGPTNFGAGGAAPSVLGGFQGISQYDVAAYGRNFIPPDTMGAAGKTQLTEFVNGGFAVFNKSNGATQLAMSDVAFWQAAGQTSANGDSRVMYNKDADRWIALSFGASVANIQIAVSDTSDATGAWHSTVFTGFAGGTADYPTLALDNNAVYIGTNNFNAAGNFRGTTLNVIPIGSLFDTPAAPTTTGLKQFVTPYNGGGADGGFAIQGVNSNAAGPDGKVLAVSLFFADTIIYDVKNAGTALATKANAQYVGIDGYDGNGPGRQPNAFPDAFPNADFANNDRVIDTLDDRFGSSVYEVDGRIYSVHTVTPTGTDYTVIRYDVYDKATGQILYEGDIGDGAHDYYQGSLAVNDKGQVVIAYNRSGSGEDGRISVMARVYNTLANGHLVQNGAEQLLKVSLVDDYHNGSIAGRVAAGRQRWGDYSVVSLDPEDHRTFWIFGEYAMEYNNAAGGHPGGTGGSRWGTWISAVNSGSVPEPSAWIIMLAGFGLAGAALRRRRTVQTA